MASLRSYIVRHSVTFLRQLERARQQGMRVSQIGEEDEDSAERRRRRRERKAAKKAAAAAAAATDARVAIDADRGHQEAPPVHNGVHKRKRDKDGEVLPGEHKAKKHKHKEKDRDKDRRKEKHRH
jgi:thiamine monophosphate synthase